MLFKAFCHMLAKNCVYLKKAPIISLPLDLFCSAPVITKTDEKLQGVANFTWRSIGCRMLLKEHLRLKSKEDLAFISKQCHCSCLCQLTSEL